MNVELQKLFTDNDSSISLDCMFDLSEIELSGSHPFNQPFHFTGGVFNRAGVVTLEGVIKGEYPIACDRCGIVYTERIHADVDYVLVESVSDEERDDFIVVNDGKLDLDPVICTEVLLALPTKHLCKNDCKGLCSNCGADLNSGECSCCKKTDNPFADALSAFFD